MEVGCCVAPLTHVSVLSSAEATLEQLSLSQSLVHVYAARRGREAGSACLFSMESMGPRARHVSMRSVGLRPSTCTCIFKVGVQSRCSKTAGAKNSWQGRICTFCGITPGRLGVVQAGRWHGPSTILGISFILGTMLGTPCTSTVLQASRCEFACWTAPSPSSTHRIKHDAIGRAARSPASPDGCRACLPRTGRWFGAIFAWRN